MAQVRFRVALPAVLLLCCAVAAQTAPSGHAYPGTIRLDVDATNAASSIFRVVETIPVAAGPIALLYPKWIPGEHGPTGPIVDSTGMKFTANGQTISWRRDDVDMYTIHVNVPAGANELKVNLEFDAPVAGEGGFSAGPSTSAKLAVMSWNWLLLYPSGYAADQIPFQATLKIPQGWKYATALREGNSGIVPGQGITFAPTTLYTLVDSPVQMGEFLRKLPLSPAGEQRPAELDIAADSAAALEIPAETASQYKNLVAEAGEMFGARHYRDYHFLLSLSDHVAHFGLEHHESNDSRVDERSLIDDTGRKLMSGLLPHEYVHSWNAKYRRPAGLATPEYEQPMKGEMLWVYEGLTSYLGDVLTARSGLLTPELARDGLAVIAAGMSHRPGRQWRPLLDTTVAAQILYESPYQWSNWRRGVDFYDEGVLLWLDADTTIRKLTDNRKSLDDWLKVFYGPPNQPLDAAPRVHPYTFEELVKSMNEVAPFDWAKFWNDRLHYVGPNAPLAGIENSGWKLVYDDHPSDMSEARASRGGLDLTYSIGLTINREGVVGDSIFFMPAYQAGIVPGMKIVAVNGRRYAPEILRDALKQGMQGKEPLQVIVENNDYFKTVSIDYHGGERFPHLVRDASKPDLLSDIMRAHVAANHP